MKKLLVVGIILLLVGVNVPSTGRVMEQTFTVSSDGNILYVGGSGEGNYTKIQDAVNDSSDGDTVFVFSGIYYENVNVKKSIILIGEDKNTTVVDGGGIDSVIEVSADNVTIEGFTVTNCQKDLSEAGINIFTDWNIIKNNNVVENQRTGIRLSGSNHNLIENNFLKDNILYHIFLKSDSNNNTMQNNTLTESDDLIKACDGIWLSHSSNNRIENNEITGLKFTVGISLDLESSYNVVYKNIIHNNTYWYDATSIQICNSDFNLISNNEIRCNNGTGIKMFFTQGNEIIGNIIDSLPYRGISLADCRYNNIIKFNNISSTEKGIYFCMYSSKNVVESNNLTNNTYGIYLFGTDLLGFVPNNVISKNNIVENDYGIYITISNYYGYSNDSLIYRNNFINNTQNAYDECSNIWNDTSVGNYWDDYNGTDSDGDCKGDTPYNISDKDNQDWYPLMIPYENKPPHAEITKPVRAIYFFNLKVRPCYFFPNSLIFGNIDIEVDASDSISGVECVEFYIDDELMSTVTDAPYSCRWGSRNYSKHKYTIKIVAFNNFRNSASDEIKVWRFL